MKNVLHPIKKAFVFLLAALFLTSACTVNKPKQQAAESPAMQSAAPAVEAADELIVRQTEPPAPAPTEPPTPEPLTSASTEPPTPEPTIKPVSDEELNDGVLDSFFNDSVLIGDSMTAGFSHFVISKRKDGVCLGDMKCIGQSGLFLKNAYEVEIGKRAPVLSYRGRTYSASDLVQELGAKALYLLLGVNDVYVNHSTAADYISYFDEIIRNTLAKSPDVQIVLITVPPVLKSYAKSCSYDFPYNNDVNEALYRYCEENGFGIVELAARLGGEDGFLNRTYCSDTKFHLNQEGDALWLGALREYARLQYESGVWTPEESADS